MIDFHLYQQIRHLRLHEKLPLRQISRRLRLSRDTVQRWVTRERFEPRKSGPRVRKLDAWRQQILAWLHEHSLSATQVWQRLKAEGYSGGYTQLAALVRQIRPKPSQAFLSLHFAPGQCGQLDWGHAGWIQIGATRRRLSFLVVVLAYSRKVYVEFTLAQTMEHFLAAQQNAFLYLGGVPHEMMVDNCKTAVLEHHPGRPPVLHPRYIDFAQHYGFRIKPCTPRQPQQKGRVENAVAYIKGNFLRGLTLDSLASLNLQARHWLDHVANVRIHAHTRKTPVELFAEEVSKLRLIHPAPYEAVNLLSVRANNRARVVFQTNRYSVPPANAHQSLTLKAYPDRVVLFDHAQRQIALHTRSYDRHQDIEQREHIESLLDQKRQGRHQQQWLRFIRLSPVAEPYHQALEQRRDHPRQHMLRILALAEHYGQEALSRAMQDAFELEAIGAEYLANILQHRSQIAREPGPLHLTRASDQLELELPAPDLSIYDGGAL